MKKPQRAHHLMLDLGADTEEELLAALKQIALQIQMGKLTTGCCGGYGHGYVYAYRVNPDMTHDRYVELNDLWLDHEKARKTQQEQRG